MNRIFKSLWSVARQCWCAVPEIAASAGKGRSGQAVASSSAGMLASVALSLSMGGHALAQAPPAPTQLPTGGRLVAGQATISQTSTAQAASLLVQQSSPKAILQWDSFNLGSAAQVQFAQPNAQAVTLNRINDANPSQIFGRITANGQVFLTNANGVYFSPSSSVDVGAFTATTHSISDHNFMSGNYVFERNGSIGKVINEGRISAALGGYIALLAPEVQNAGVVMARAGTVAMAAGEMIKLNVDGMGSLAGIVTTPSAIATLIENKQAVQTPDGQIILSAMALSKLQSGVIKNSGSLEASSLVNKGGRIVLEGDEITLSRNSKIEAKGPAGGGTVLVGGDWQGSGELRQATKVTMEAGVSIDASATDRGDGGKVVLWSDVHKLDSVTRVNGSIKAEAGPHGGDGGRIETSGQVLNVDDSQVSTYASQGQSGQWLLDPYNITISTGTQTSGLTLSSGVFSTNTNASILNTTTLQNALASGNVEVSTTGVGTQAGDIAISNNISWTSSSTLKLTAAGVISGTGNIAMGAGGGLTFNQTGISSGTTLYSGIISGDGTFTKDGAGTSILTGANTYTGTTTISAGTLQIGNSSTTTLMGTGAVVNNGILAFKNATNQSFAPNTISGTGSVVVSGQTYGSGTLTLQADNSFSGGMTINSGPRVVAGGNSTSTAGTITSGPFGTGTVTLTNGQIELAGYNIGNTLKSTIIPTSTTPSTVYFNNGSGTAELSGTLDLSTSGSGLVFSPALGNTLRLTGVLAAYSATIDTKLRQTGAGDVYEGFSSVSDKYRIQLDASAGKWTLGNGTVGTKASLYQYGGTFDFAGNDLGANLDGQNSYFYAGVLLNSASSTSKVWTQNVNIPGNVTVSTPNVGGDIDLTKPAYIFGNASVYTLTKTGAGDLHLRSSYLSSTTDFNINVQAGNLWYDVNSRTAISYAGIYTLALGSKLYLNQDSAVTIPGVITGAGSVVVRTSTTLSGNNTYTGGTTVLNNATLTQGVAAVMSGDTIVSSAIGTGTITLGDATIRGAYSLGSYATLANNVVINGAATIFSAANSTISGLISDGSNTGQGLTFSSGASTTVQVAGNNTYTGTTTISAGTLKLGSATALGTGAVSVASGAALDLNGQTLTGTGGLTLNGTGISSGGALMNSSATGATYAGLVALGSATSIVGGTGSISLSNTGTISGSYALTLGGTAGGSIASIVGTGTGT